MGYSVNKTGLWCKRTLNKILSFLFCSTWTGNEFLTWEVGKYVISSTSSVVSYSPSLDRLVFRENDTTLIIIISYNVNWVQPVFGMRFSFKYFIFISHYLNINAGWTQLTLYLTMIISVMITFMIKVGKEK